MTDDTLDDLVRRLREPIGARSLNKEAADATVALRERARELEANQPCADHNFAKHISGQLTMPVRCAKCGAIVSAAPILPVADEVEAMAKWLDEGTQQNDGPIAAMLRSLSRQIAAKDAEISARSDIQQAYLDCWRNDKARAEKAEAGRDAAVHALMELRMRLHAAGRRPEECYEMSLIDDALSTARRP